MSGFEIITRENLDPARQDDLLLYPRGERRQPSRIIPPEEEILTVRKEGFRSASLQVGFNNFDHIFLRFFGGEAKDTPDSPRVEKLIVLDATASTELRRFLNSQWFKG